MILLYHESPQPTGGFFYDFYSRGIIGVIIHGHIVHIYLYTVKLAWVTTSKERPSISSKRPVAISRFLYFLYWSQLLKYGFENLCIIKTYKPLQIRIKPII